MCQRWQMGAHLHLCERGESEPVEVELLLQGLGREEESARQGSREADVEDPSWSGVQVWLDVEDEHVLDRHGQHGRHALQEVPQQWGQEVFLGHVLEADRHAAAQHVLGDDENPENALGRDAVDAI